MIVGVIHLLSLPASPGYKGNFRKIVEDAHHQADIFSKTGFDGVIIENFNDYPFSRKADAPQIAAMSIIADKIKCSS